MAIQFKYKLPNSSTVHTVKGKLIPVQSFDNYSGPIISDNESNVIYGVKQEIVQVKSMENHPPLVYSKEEYLQRLQKFQSDFPKKQVQKAIFSRIKNIGKINNTTLFFKTLCAAYPNAFVYEVQSKKFGHWIGVSPEILVHHENEIAKTVALAGTKQTTDNENWTEKEIQEQEYVKQFIVTCLEQHQLQWNVSKRKEKNAGPVKHLVNEFSFSLEREQLFTLIKDLHPTPAVCGIPKNNARNLIQQYETHQRKLYTGIVGVVDATIQLYVNLRCAQIVENEIYAYVGGGITKDSIPEKEWEETELKASTLENIIRTGK